MTHSHRTSQGRLVAAAVMTSLALGTIPMIGSITPASAATVVALDQVDAGSGDVVFRTVATSVVVDREFTQLNDFLTYLGSAQVSFSFAIPVDGKLVNQAAYYPTNTAESDTYNGLSTADKKRAQLAKSLLTEVFIAEATDANTISEKSVAKLGEWGVSNTDKNFLAAVGASLLSKAIDTGDPTTFELGASKDAITRAVDTLYDLAPQFTNDISAFGGMVFNTPQVIDGLSNGASTKVFIPTMAGNEGGYTVSSFRLPAEGGNTDPQDLPAPEMLPASIKIAGIGRTGVYKGIVDMQAPTPENPTPLTTYASVVSLDTAPKNADISNDQLFTDAPSSDAYDALSEDAQKRAYLGATLILEGHHFGESGTLRDNLDVNLAAIGADQLSGDQIATLGQMLMLSAYHSDFNIESFRDVMGSGADAVIEAFQSASSVASRIENNISEDHIRTRVDFDTSALAYAPSDNVLLSFASLRFAQEDPITEPSDDPTAEPTTDPATDSSDEPTTEPSDEPTTDPSDNPTTTKPTSPVVTTPKPTTTDPSVTSEPSVPSDTDPDATTPKDTDTDDSITTPKKNAIISRDDGAVTTTPKTPAPVVVAGGAPGVAQQAPVNTASATKVPSTLGNDLRPARADYSGTFSGGISSSIDGVVFDENGNPTVETGGDVKTSLLAKIRSIF